MIVCVFCGWAPSPKDYDLVDGTLSPIRAVAAHGLMHCFPDSLSELRSKQKRRFVG